MITVYIPPEVSFAEIIDHAHIIKDEHIHAATSAKVTYTDDAEYTRALEIKTILDWLTR